MEINQWADDRKFTILMVAAEAGDVEVVNYLIDRGSNVDCEVNSETPASLAFSNNHHVIVLALLKANSLIPRNYKRDDASDELKAFVDLCEQLHTRIRDNSAENVDEIFTANPTVRHFYDSHNHSALRTAMVCAMFTMIEVLIKNNIILAPHEDLEDIRRRMAAHERRELRDLFLKFSPYIFTDTMMTLMRNCRFGADGKNHPDYMHFACKAFHVLLENPLIAINLKIVAAKRDFVIVFDFNRDWVNFVDPTTEPYTNGIFYLSGTIYIAAKNMLVPEKANEIISVMAHELCHYAMYLVFSNEAKPYRESDKRGEEIFTGISEMCERQKDEEKIVGLVYKCYTEDMHHAELAVRAPQMIAFYDGKPELDTRRTIFPNLFTDYEHRIIPEMERELPRIRHKFRPKQAKKIKNHKFAGVLIGVVVLLSFVAYLFFNRVNLSENQKIAVRNADLTYHGAELKLGQLFADTSTFYDSFSSDHIKNALQGDKFKLTKAVKSLYDPLVYLTWSNMTETLRDKLLTSKVNFQGESVELGQVLSNHDALNSLNTSEIRDIFDGYKFKISAPVEIKTKFLVERSFVDEKFEIISSNNEDEEVNINQFEEIFFQKMLKLLIKRTFVDEKFRIKSSDSEYDDDEGDLIVINQFEVKNAENVFEEVKVTRTFLLSDKAGEGKSTTFRNFALLLKQKYPLKWVQFLDLKKHDKAFAHAKKSNLTFDTLIELEDFLSSSLLNLNEVENQIFLDLFESGNAILLYDGVDEISPDYNDLILNLIDKVKELTENLQFVSTRPQHSVKIQTRLKVKAYKFLPLNEADRWNLFVKFVMLNNPEFDESCENEFFNFSPATDCSQSIKIKEIVERGKNILKSFEKLPESGLCSSTAAGKFTNEFDIFFRHIALIGRKKSLEEFLQDFFKKQSIKEFSAFLLNCPNLFSKVSSRNNNFKKIFRKAYYYLKVKFNRFVFNPLLIELISEFVSVPESSFNFYSAYEEFIVKKIEIVFKKGKIVRNEFAKSTLYSQNVMRVHQAFAIKLLFKNLGIVRKQKFPLSDRLLTIVKSTSKLSFDKISRIGILQVTSDDDFEFSHQTFAEFFVAHLLIESLNNYKELNEEERNIGFELLTIVLLDTVKRFDVIKQFVITYAENNVEVSGLWKEFKAFSLRLERLKLVSRSSLTWEIFFCTEFNALLKDRHYSVSLSLTQNAEVLIDLRKNWESIKEIFDSETFYNALTSTDVIATTVIYISSLFVKIF